MLTKGWPTDCHQLSGEGLPILDVSGLTTILAMNLRMWRCALWKSLFFFMGLKGAWIISQMRCLTCQAAVHQNLRCDKCGWGNHIYRVTHIFKPLWVLTGKLSFKLIPAHSPSTIVSFHPIKRLQPASETSTLRMSSSSESECIYLEVKKAVFSAVSLAKKSFCYPAG